MRKNPEAFERNKGKIMEHRSRESDSKGGKKSQETHRKKNAMKEALLMVMNMNANDKDTSIIKKKFPDLEDYEINGFTEVAVMMREHARKVPAATAKLIEMMGGSEEEKSTGMTIIVQDKETEELIESLGDTIPR